VPRRQCRNRYRWRLSAYDCDGSTLLEQLCQIPLQLIPAGILVSVNGSSRSVMGLYYPVDLVEVVGVMNRSICTLKPYSPSL
jgi:hypothetical protein